MVKKILKKAILANILIALISMSTPIMAVTPTPDLNIDIDLNSSTKVVEQNEQIEFSVSFVNPFRPNFCNPVNTFTGYWDFGDGQKSLGTIVKPNTLISESYGYDGIAGYYKASYLVNGVETYEFCNETLTAHGQSSTEVIVLPYMFELIQDMGIASYDEIEIGTERDVFTNVLINEEKFAELKTFEKQLPAEAQINWVAYFEYGNGVKKSITLEPGENRRNFPTTEYNALGTYFPTFYVGVEIEWGDDSEVITSNSQSMRVEIVRAQSKITDTTLDDPIVIKESEPASVVHAITTEEIGNKRDENEGFGENDEKDTAKLKIVRTKEERSEILGETDSLPGLTDEAMTAKKAKPWTIILIPITFVAISTITFAALKFNKRRIPKNAVAEFKR